MQNTDASMVAQSCRLQDEGASLRAALQEHGAILKKPTITPRGEVVGTEYYSHPSLRELRRIGSEELALAKELGISPQARVRLGLAAINLQERMKPDGVDLLKKQRAKRLGLPDPGIDSWRAPVGA